MTERLCSIMESLLFAIPCSMSWRTLEGGWHPLKTLFCLQAHNCRKFDSLVLCSAMEKVPIVKLHERFRGFCDTLEFFRAILSFSERFSLENLVTHVLKISYNAHDALEDSNVLRRLTELPQHAIEEHYLNHSFDATGIFNIVFFQSQVKQNFETLKPLVVHNAISKNIAKKISQSGLSYYHLKLAFSRNPQEGIRNLFTEATNGHVRITKRNNIISFVTNYFQER